MTSRHHHQNDGLFSSTNSCMTKFLYSLPLVLCYAVLTFMVGCSTKEKSEHKPDGGLASKTQTVQCRQDNVKIDSNTITAEVVALEQIITYNRFGAFNPAGMVYALRKDVVDEQGKEITSKTDSEMAGLAGKVRLRDGKRPRPLVLRVHEGECLQVKFWNLLSPLPTVHTIFQRPDFPEGGVQRHAVLETPAGNPNNPAAAKATDLSTPPRNDPNALHKFPFPRQEEPDYPTTRSASIHVNGLDYANIESDGANVGKNTSSLAEPGTSKTYTWYARQEGGYFFYSAGALAGGEGDGGQLGLGLFGSVNVEPKGSVWYRSQVVHKDLVDAAGSDTDYSKIDYEALAIVKGGVIQHSDLNAIIYQTDKTSETPDVCAKRSPGSSCGMSFREFTTIFHDENKIFQAFSELSDEGNPISAVADGMAINYGSSGVGSVVLANKKNIGPGKNCPDCKLEEFFLSSWVNGDPAMIVRRDIDGNEVEALYPDDPSNVHHAYLGDPVRFRNIHAGPKETHVFHLHAHQWLQDQNDPNANYLDSQTISPGSSYTYDIQYGGGGNRNLTVGDAIFHCHLYPHFAAGMWELWRNHDVFEDGLYVKKDDPTSNPSNLPAYRYRNLPDAEIVSGTPNPAIVPIPGFPIAPLPTAEFRGYPFFMAAESGHRPPQPPMDMALNEKAGAKDDKWLDGGLPRHIITAGTIKNLEPDELLEGKGDRNANKASRYVAKRTWQLNSDENNLTLAKELESATVKIVPQCGTKDEILAMAYHAGWDKTTIAGLKLGNKPSDMPDKIWLGCKDEFKQALTELPDSFQWNYQPKPTVWPINRMIHSDSAKPNSPLAAMSALWKGLGYEVTNSATPKNHKANKAFDPGKQFRINGFAPAQGAPFADPCPTEYYQEATQHGKTVPVNRLSPRIYKSAYIQFDMTVNKYGWHDPQARMPVLEEDAVDTLSGKRLAEPLFFRANSGDCIQFQATNLIPSVLNLDDFQVYSPTDTIGQHIHLVKFDVTSSDGSANGWNYEDGTFSPDEVRERIDASNHKASAENKEGSDGNGKVVDWKGQPSNILLKAKTHPMFMDKGSMHAMSGLGTCSNTEEDLKEHPWCGAQTTVQRWWADPVLNEKWDDRTMRAVFTHDHYGPSSHQQHGFYAALIVEPKDSVWTQLGASPEQVTENKDDNISLKCADKSIGIGDKALGGAVNGKPVKCVNRNDGGPTSYAANIGFIDKANNSTRKDEVRREYNLAFADFAILYNADLRPVNPPSRQADLMLPHNVRDGLKPKPEGISTEDPGTRLLNYRNEPIPLRIAEEDKNSLEYHQKFDKASQIASLEGDMSNVFSSVIHNKLRKEIPVSSRMEKLKKHVPNEIIDEGMLTSLLVEQRGKTTKFTNLLNTNEPWRVFGDPSTPILAAYEGDPLQLHLIQGAQEEQHVFSMNGIKWLAEPHSPNSGYMNGQQIGISEHFEFNMAVSVPRSEVTDYWFGSPAVENMWDGMWGLLRAKGWEMIPGDEEGTSRPAKINDLARLPESAVSVPPMPFGDPERLACPSDKSKPPTRFYITAWQASQLNGLIYNSRPNFAISDPNALVFFDIPAEVAVKAGGTEAQWNDGKSILQYLKSRYVDNKNPIEPLVLRANAGDCVKIEFMNYLPKIVEKMEGNHVSASNQSYNLMPPIVNGFNFNQVQMSNHIGLVPQLVAENVANSEGSNVGMNPRQADLPDLAGGCQVFGNDPFKECDSNNKALASHYTWYMGDQKVLTPKAKEASPCHQAGCIDQEMKDLTMPDGKQITGYIRYTPIEFGAVSIRSFGDVIKHSSHGLVGALIVEPIGSKYSYPVQNAAGKPISSTTADIQPKTGEKFREFVLLIQDDLSLKQHNQPMPNHRMADDAEDTGQKGFNYRTEPLWARNGIGTSGADFNVLNNVDYSNTLSSINPNTGCQGSCGDPQTPVFSATAGEPVRFRVIHPGGHSRQHAFVLHGHNWDYQPWINDSTQLFDRTDATKEEEKPKTARIGAIGGMGPARHVNILTQAGGNFAVPGDYLFRVQEQFQFHGGMWGIFRVNPKPLASN
jgi:manganese oxidase